MPSDFTYRRRVQFAETDMAGIVHFSWYFRYMEEAEHAWWRSLGLQIAPEGHEIGWPRVAAACEFKASLKFDDEFEVHVQIESIGNRSLRYAFTLRRGDTLIATGSMTSVCVRKGPDGVVTPVALPEDVVARLR